MKIARHDRSPINPPLKRRAIPIRQCVDVFDQIPILLGIQQHLSAGAVVLGFVALPAHGELGGAQVGFDVEVEVALEVGDFFDRGNGVDEVALEQRVLDEVLHFGGPGVEVADEADFGFAFFGIEITQADVLARVFNRHAAQGIDAAEGSVGVVVV